MSVAARFDFVRPPHGGPRDWAPQAAEPHWEIDFACAVQAAAKAQRRTGSPAGARTISWEVAGLRAHVTTRRGRALAWRPRWQEAPPHVGQFLTQSLGLAVAVQHARDLYGWNGRYLMANVDALPARLRWLRPGGCRPDFVFNTPGGLRAAEARGRSSATVGFGWSDPTGDQLRRAEQIDDWAQKVARHVTPRPGPGWSMCWTWISPRGCAVDVFDPGEPMELTPEMLQALEAASDERDDRSLQASLEQRAAVAEVGRDGIVAVAAERVAEVTEDGFVEWVVTGFSSQDLPADLYEVGGGPVPPTDGLMELVEFAHGRRVVGAVVRTEPGVTLTDADAAASVGAILRRA